MGDRANVFVKQAGVFLYTHWNGRDLPQAVHKALAKRWRWSDPAYLTRIIFDVMTEGQQGKETGFGIRNKPDDNSSPFITIDCDQKRIGLLPAACPNAELATAQPYASWSLEEFVATPEPLYQAYRKGAA